MMKFGNRGRQSYSGGHRGHLAHYYIYCGTDATIDCAHQKRKYSLYTRPANNRNSEIEFYRDA